MNGRMNSKRSFDKKHTRVLGTLGMLLIIMIIAGCGNSKSTFRNDSATKDNREPSGSSLLTQENLGEIVSNNAGLSLRVRYATISGEGPDKNVEIGVDRPANCGDGSIEGVMASFSGKIMSNLFEYPETSSVAIIMYGVDQGVVSDGIAIRVAVNRATAQEIDWSMFGPMTMASMVNEYYIHPGFQTNPGF